MKVAQQVAREIQFLGIGFGVGHGKGPLKQAERFVAFLLDVGFHLGDLGGVGGTFLLKQAQLQLIAFQLIDCVVAALIEIVEGCQLRIVDRWRRGINRNRGQRVSGSAPRRLTAR